MTSTNSSEKNETSFMGTALRASIVAAFFVPPACMATGDTRDELGGLELNREDHQAHADEARMDVIVFDGARNQRYTSWGDVSSRGQITWKAWNHTETLPGPVGKKVVAFSEFRHPDDGRIKQFAFFRDGASYVHRDTDEDGNWQDRPDAEDWFLPLGTSAPQGFSATENKGGGIKQSLVVNGSFHELNLYRATADGACDPRSEAPFEWPADAELKWPFGEDGEVYSPHYWDERNEGWLPDSVDGFAVLRVNRHDSDETLIMHHYVASGSRILRKSSRPCHAQGECAACGPWHDWTLEAMPAAPWDDDDEIGGINVYMPNGARAPRPEPVDISLRTYIPCETAWAPVYYQSDRYFNGGDKTDQTVRVTPGRSEYTDVERHMSETRSYTSAEPGSTSWCTGAPTSAVFATATQEVTDYTLGQRFVSNGDGWTTVNFQVNANNPLAASPEINANVFVGVSDAGEYVVSGLHDGFPAYELRIDGMLVHDFNPHHAGTSPNALFPPMDQGVELIGTY